MIIKSGTNHGRPRAGHIYGVTPKEAAYEVGAPGARRPFLIVSRSSGSRVLSGAMKCLGKSAGMTRKALLGSEYASMRRNSPSAYLPVGSGVSKSRLQW